MERNRDVHVVTVVRQQPVRRYGAMHIDREILKNDVLHDPRQRWLVPHDGSWHRNLSKARTHASAICGMPLDEDGISYHVEVDTIRRRPNKSINLRIRPLGITVTTTNAQFAREVRALLRAHGYGNASRKATEA